MGKANDIIGPRRPECIAELTAPICGSACCRTSTDVDVDKSSEPSAEEEEEKTTTKLYEESHDDIKELVVIGAGPHSLSLLLRLLEPDADLLSDKERHQNAEKRSKMRPISHVYSHLAKLARGPSATLKPTTRTKRLKKKKCSCHSAPPPLSLETIRNSVLVVDKNGDEWMKGWKQNFDAIGIDKLRSLMNAHADPYDHRSLEFYADMQGRGEELVTLPSLRQRNRNFRGPYQVPSTKLFHDFHNLLASGYGIDDMVRQGTVTSIDPVWFEGEEEPIFQVTIAFDSSGDCESDIVVSHPPIIVETRRVVCAMGPIFHAREAFWESSLKTELKSKLQPYPTNRILHPSEIVPFLQKCRNATPPVGDDYSHHEHKHQLRLLIVGGGITSAQLALLAAKSSWCQSVKLIQRSTAITRHFDIPNEWMGPRRGLLLDRFWSLSMPERAQLLQKVRRGGSIPPETLMELEQCCACGEKGQEEEDAIMVDLECQEEVEVSRVQWEDERFLVTMDDGSPTQEYDMIWLATGSENHLDSYSALTNLRESLPVEVVSGLPVLNEHLSWSSPPDMEANEPEWKKMARKRFWCMGILAGLELGPDALNLVGGRHGAVRVAKDIRNDMRNRQNMQC